MHRKQLEDGFIAVDSAPAVEGFFARADEISTLRAMIHTEIASALRRDQIKQAVVFARPSRLRVDVFASGVNHLLSVAIVRNGELRAYDTEENTLFVGRASAENIATVLRVPFTPEEFMLWVCGRFVVPSGAARGGVWQRESEYAVEISYRDGRSVRLFLAPAKDGLVLDRLELYVGEALVLASAYGYDEQSMRALPQSIRFSLPVEDVTGEMTIVQATVNPPLTNENLFSLSLPASVRVESLDADN